MPTTSDEGKFQSVAECYYCGWFGIVDTFDMEATCPNCNRSEALLDADEQQRFGAIRERAEQAERELATIHSALDESDPEWRAGDSVSREAVAIRGLREQLAKAQADAERMRAAVAKLPHGPMVLVSGLSEMIAACHAAAQPGAGKPIALAEEQLLQSRSERKEDYATLNNFLRQHGKEKDSLHPIGAMILFAEDQAGELARLREEAERLTKERNGWHCVVKDCEKVLEMLGTAESPLMSNLANVVRDKRTENATLRQQVADKTTECESWKKIATDWSDASKASEQPPEFYKGYNEAVMRAMQAKLTLARQQLSKARQPGPWGIVIPFQARSRKNRKLFLDNQTEARPSNEHR